jgi:hypothetical protein
MEALCRYLDTRLVWVFWISTSVVTTALLLQGELVFPMHVLFTQLIVAQTIQLFLYAIDRNSSHTYQSLSPSKIWHAIDLPRLWQTIDLSSLVLGVLMAPILITAYKAIHLSDDLPNLILILSLDWRPADLLEKFLDWKLGASDVARYLVFTAGLYLVCVCNFRLRPIPWEMSMLFLLFSGLAQVCSRGKINLTSRPIVSPVAEQQQQALPKYWLLCSLTVLAIVLHFQPERIHPDRSPLSASAVLTALVGLVSTSSLFALGPVFQELKEIQEPQDIQQTSPGEGYSTRLEDAMLRLGIAGLAIASDSLFYPRPLNVSFWQYLGYGMASLAFLTWEDLEFLTWGETSWRPQWLAQSKDGLTHGQERRLTRGTLVLLFLIGGAWLCALLNPLIIMPAPLEYTNLVLNPSPFPASELEIVIARYAEPAAEVARVLESLLAAKSVRAVHARVTIYNKNTDTMEFERDLRASLASKVNVSCHALENVGREADTYLRHILSNWDNLANHTLFAQAEVEGLSSTVGWIDTFFNPRTGFLQLSYEGHMCADCSHCGEWTDDPAVLSELFSLANPNRQCRNLVWTFRGQFIVSGARIRANGKDVYETVLRNLTDPDNKMHAPEYTQGIWHSAQKDSLNDPVFGFTVERFWGILMQCSEPRVGHQSPSQFAVSMRPKWLAGGFHHEDAQCLDPPMVE